MTGKAEGKNGPILREPRETLSRGRYSHTFFFRFSPSDWCASEKKASIRENELISLVLRFQTDRRQNGSDASVSADKEAAEDKCSGGLSALEITFLDHVICTTYILNNRFFWDKRRT